MSDRKRVLIDAPSEMVILAARHLDATEGPVQVGAIVDTAARSAITTVLRYIAKAHNAPAVTGEKGVTRRPCRYCPDPLCPEDCPECGSPIHDLDAVPAQHQCAGHHDESNPPVRCWHTEPDSPCDWDVCRQPERLAAGDRGTDPARKEPS